jgi:hypothetical protein
MFLCVADFAGHDTTASLICKQAPRSLSQVDLLTIHLNISSCTSNILNFIMRMGIPGHHFHVPFIYVYYIYIYMGIRLRGLTHSSPCLGGCVYVLITSSLMKWKTRLSQYVIVCLSAWTLWFVAGDPAVEAKVLEGKHFIHCSCYTVCDRYI